MIKVSRLADYAVVVLATMAAKSEQELMTGTGLSRTTGLPEPTVSKLLKLLTKAQILSSVRGANGGYRLTHLPEAISIADIVIAVDGPVALTACVEGSNTSCDYTCSCPVKGRWDFVNDAVRGALEEITLADMMKDNKPRKKVQEGLHA